MDEIADFIAEIERWPSFVAAATADPFWKWEMPAYERALRAIEEAASLDPRGVDFWDRLRAAMKEDEPLNERAVRVHSIMVEASKAFAAHRWGGEAAGLHRAPS